MIVVPKVGAALFRYFAEAAACRGAEEWVDVEHPRSAINFRLLEYLLRAAVFVQVRHQKWPFVDIEFVQGFSRQ